MSVSKRARLEQAAPPAALCSVATPAETPHDARAAVSTLGRACARLPIRFAASVDTFHHLKASAGEDVADWARAALFAFRDLVSSRVKALEALAEAQDVSRKQLDALAHMCEGAAGSGDAEAVETALSVCEPLLEPGVAPVEEAYCVMGSRYGDVLLKAGTWGRVASGASTVCEGRGLVRFTSSTSNTFQLVCVDDAGAALESLCSDDVDVVVEGGTVVSCDVAAPGMVEVCYGVDCGVTAITLRVSVFGSPVVGSPWRACYGLVNKCVRKIEVGRDASCLAVSPNGSLLAICDYLADEVRMYSLPDGVMMRVLRADVLGMALGTIPLTLCFSGDSANIIGAGSFSSYLLEATITGSVLRTFGATNKHLDGYTDVKTDGCVVVAGKTTEVVVIDYVTGSILHNFRSFGGPGASVLFVRGIELTAGKHILVAASSGEGGQGGVVVVKLTIDGVYVEEVFKDSESDTEPISVTATEAGEVILLTEDEMAVKAVVHCRILGLGRCEYLAPPPGISTAASPIDAASIGRFLYVLDQYLAHVFVYE